LGFVHFLEIDHLLIRSTIAMVSLTLIFFGFSFGPSSVLFRLFKGDGLSEGRRRQRGRCRLLRLNNRAQEKRGACRHRHQRQTTHVFLPMHCLIVPEEARSSILICEVWQASS
jgi:hypothetical protein